MVFHTYLVLNKEDLEDVSYLNVDLCAHYLLFRCILDKCYIIFNFCTDSAMATKEIKVVLLGDTGVGMYTTFNTE